MPPVLLAIETSQREGGVALRGPDGRIDSESLGGEQRHDDALMPAIDRLFVRTGLAPRDLEVIGVDIGPGGFTGLRIAITTAKMLADVLDAAVVPVPGALVAAESLAEPDRHERIIVAAACKSETFWATRLVRSAGAWQIEGEGRLVTAGDWVPNDVNAVVADHYLPQPAADRCLQLGVPILRPAYEPAACLAAADRLWGRGEQVDPVALGPIYPRPPEAVSLWQKRRSTDRHVR